jgi:hypothetical protein
MRKSRKYCIQESRKLTEILLWIAIAFALLMCGTLWAVLERFMSITDVVEEMLDGKRKVWSAKAPNESRTFYV